MPGVARLRAAIARVVIAALLLPAAFGLGGADPEWMLGTDAAGDESARHAAHDHPGRPPGLSARALDAW